jgi:hypothetical protein
VSTILAPYVIVPPVDQPQVRRGLNDKPVEIYSNGKLIQSYMSYVQVGQPWHALEGNAKDKWFVCLTPVKLDYSRDPKNPTLILGAMNVLQADSLDSKVHKAPKAVHRLGVEALADVLDVEFK